MTPDSALDSVAFLVGLRLMGADARRRLRIALARSPDCVGHPGFDLERLERLDALLDGRRLPETLQDRLDLVRGERERAASPFEPTFWLTRTAELMAAGFAPQQAAGLINDIRGRVETSSTDKPAEHIGEVACC